MKVYVIFEGCYSDRHVVGVAIDETITKTLLNVHKSWDCVEYDTDNLFALTTEGRVYRVMLADGIYTATKITDDMVGCYVGDVGVVSRCRPLNMLHTNNTAYFVNVIAKNEETAIRIAQDKIAEYKATQKGVV